MAHLQKHSSMKHAAEELDVSVATVNNWRNRFTREGLQGLKDKHRSGRKSKLTDEQMDQLPALINGLVALKPHKRVLITDIQAQIAKQFDVHYESISVYNLLIRKGLSWNNTKSKNTRNDTKV